MLHAPVYAGTRQPARVGRAVTTRKNLTLIGAPSVRGLNSMQLLDGILNQRSFAFCISQILDPQLRPSDVLVLDNLSVHKFGGLQQALARRGVGLLSVPPPTCPSSRLRASLKPSGAKQRPTPEWPCNKQYKLPSIRLPTKMLKPN